MLENITGAFSKFVWRYLYPKNLVVGIGQSIAASCRAFSNAKELANTEYNPVGVGGISCLSVPTSNIRKRYLISSIDTVTTTTKSGARKDSVFGYIISGLPKGLVAIGKAPDSNLAILYADFCSVGESYAFKENPTKFGTVSSNEEQPKVSFYCLFANSEHKHKNSLTALYKENNNKEVVEVTDFVRIDGKITNGVSGAGINMVSGNKPATLSGGIKSMWTENGKKFCATGSEIINVSGQGYSKPLGYLLTPGCIAGKYNTSVAVFSVGNKTYWTDREQVNTALYPGFTTTYPLVPTTSGCAAIDELIGTMHSIYGKDTVVVDENTTKDSEKLLESVIPANGSVHIVSVINDTLKSIHALTTANDYDTIYVFYSDLDATHISQTASEIIKKNGGGAMRISNCIKYNDNYIYGASTGCTYLGCRPDINDKVYAVGIGSSESVINQIVRFKFISKRNIQPTRELAVKLLVQPLVLV